MASIILSFVGTQDPYSDRTKEEGSIVTLVKHLLAEKTVITCLYLLFTDDLHERAELTEQWLTEEIGITIKIELIPVDPALSEDPIDISLATNAAKKALELARSRAAEGDIFEFNFSSGTPTMKSTWSVLQSAGYAPHSRVWQVRNPSEMRVGQPRVFAADSSILKAEFDRQIVQQQLSDYNYSGALANFLRVLMEDIGLKPPIEYRDIDSFWVKVRSFDNGNLYRQLVNDRIVTDKWVYVQTMSKIVEYTNQHQSLLQISARLQQYCQDRNNYIHKLEGISQLDKADLILNDLKSILKQLTPVPDTNTFDRLNQDILSQLAVNTRSA